MRETAASQMWPRGNFHNQLLVAGQSLKCASSFSFLWRRFRVLHSESSASIQPCPVLCIFFSHPPLTSCLTTSINLLFGLPLDLQSGSSSLITFRQSLTSQTLKQIWLFFFQSSTALAVSAILPPDRSTCFSWRVPAWILLHLLCSCRFSYLRSFPPLWQVSACDQPRVDVAGSFLETLNSLLYTCN